MTDEQILAMFTPGSKWRIRTTDGKYDDIRTVDRTLGYSIRFLNEKGQEIITKPLVGELVIEAGGGYVKVDYSGIGICAIFTRIDGQRKLF